MLMSYTTDRLEIKVLNKDAAPLVLAFYEENKGVFEPWEPERAENFYSLSYQKASLNIEYQQMQEGKVLRYWVFLKGHPEEIIGSFCFQNFLRGPYQSCSLGYKFGLRFHNRGYAYESIQQGIQLLFEQQHFHRIEAFIMPSNLPSINLINKLNFTCEGISYSYANINGIWTDHRRYSLINPRDAAKPADHTRENII